MTPWHYLEEMRNMAHFCWVSSCSSCETGPRTTINLLTMQVLLSWGFILVFTTMLESISSPPLQASMPYTHHQHFFVWTKTLTPLEFSILILLFFLLTLQKWSINNISNTLPNSWISHKRTLSRPGSGYPIYYYRYVRKTQIKLWDCWAANK